MVGSLNDIPASENKVSGSQGISVLMGNSLMFQRFPVHDGYEDPQLSDFYGMTMPLLKRGIPVGITHIENVGYEEALKDLKVLVMTYSNMKPMDPEAHVHIADWVRKGGALIYCGSDSDPFQTVREWWNTGSSAFDAPSDHLFSLMGIQPGAPEGNYEYGEGTVRILRKDPKEYVLVPDADGGLLDAVKELYAISGGILEFKNSFRLSRGPYELVAVLDESVSEEPFRLSGKFIDLYDPALPVLTEVTVQPGSQAYLFNLDKAGKAPAILAAASRAYEVKRKGKTFSFVAKGPVETTNVSRILLRKKPSSVLVQGRESFDPTNWDEVSHTYLLSFENSPEGVQVMFK